MGMSYRAKGAGKSQHKKTRQEQSQLCTGSSKNTHGPAKAHSFSEPKLNYQQNKFLREIEKLSLSRQAQGNLELTSEYNNSARSLCMDVCTLVHSQAHPSMDTNKLGLKTGTQEY